MYRFPEVEGQQGKYEEGQGDDQEGVLEDGGSERDKEEDVSSKHAEAREEDEEVEDKEHGEDALVALLGVYLEHTLHGVDLGLQGLLGYRFLHYIIIIINLKS